MLLISCSWVMPVHCRNVVAAYEEDVLAAALLAVTGGWRLEMGDLD